MSCPRQARTVWPNARRGNLGVAAPLGEVRGGVAPVVLDRAVGAVLEQDARGLAVVVEAGPVQRRVPILVLRIHVAPALDEGRGQLGPVVAEGHLDQHRVPVLVAVLQLSVGGPP